MPIKQAGYISATRYPRTNSLAISSRSIHLGPRPFRLVASFVAAEYFLAASRGLPQGAGNFYGSGLVTGLALWVAASALFVATHVLLWTDRPGWGRTGRDAIAATVLSLPPIGILGWAHPVTAAVRSAPRDCRQQMRRWPHNRRLQSALGEGDCRRWFAFGVQSLVSRRTFRTNARAHPMPNELGCASISAETEVESDNSMVRPGRSSLTPNDRRLLRLDPRPREWWQSHSSSRYR